MKKGIISFCFFVLSTTSLFAKDTYLLADLRLLTAAQLPYITKDDSLKVAFTRLSDSERDRLSAVAHRSGRCGSFEAFPEFGRLSFDLVSSEEMVEQIQKRIFAPLRVQKLMSMKSFMQADAVSLESKDWIQQAVNQVDENNLNETVKFLSAFPHRMSGKKGENDAIEQLSQKLTDLLESSGSIQLINHKGISQKSIRVRFEGAEHPEQVVVVGAHIDSISRTLAPGADDDGSGSANMAEVIRIIKDLRDQFSRSVEVYFYAGEEQGLLGSRDIAAAYKSKKMDVVAALQLDMTLHPGSGELTFANITDYTNASLREMLAQLNTTYVGGKMIETECGYGCSDHASWFRQGYPTVFPFESAFKDYNQNIHTKNDVINQRSSFKHSAMFAKLAVAFVLELATTDWRPQGI